jgi:hypothetical protein
LRYVIDKLTHRLVEVYMPQRIAIFEQARRIVRFSSVKVSDLHVMVINFWTSFYLWAASDTSHFTLKQKVKVSIGFFKNRINIDGAICFNN